jgi:hypothetical protein
MKRCIHIKRFLSQGHAKDVKISITIDLAVLVLIRVFTEWNSAEYEILYGSNFTSAEFRTIPWNSVIFSVRNSVYVISVISSYRKP